jgi:hypothetical protein
LAVVLKRAVVLIARPVPTRTTEVTHITGRTAFAVFSSPNPANRCRIKSVMVIANQLGSDLAIVEVCDLESNSCFPVTLDLTLFGAGDVVRDHTVTRTTTPGCNTIFHSVGTSHLATAAGMVTAFDSSLTHDRSYMRFSHRSAGK